MHAYTQTYETMNNTTHMYITSILTYSLTHTTHVVYTQHVHPHKT